MTYFFITEYGTRVFHATLSWQENKETFMKTKGIDYGGY
jgi:hypothetical protein